MKRTQMHIAIVALIIFCASLSQPLYSQIKLGGKLKEKAKAVKAKAGVKNPTSAQGSQVNPNALNRNKGFKVEELTLLSAPEVPRAEWYVVGGGGLSGKSSTIWKSTNGKSWEIAYDDQGYEEFYDVTEHKGVIFAAGGHRGIASSNGKDWTTVDLGKLRQTTSGPVGFEIKGVASGDGFFLICGTKSGIAYSPDPADPGKWQYLEFSGMVDGNKGMTHFYGANFIDGSFYVMGNFGGILELKRNGGKLEVVNKHQTSTEGTKTLSTVARHGDIMVASGHIGFSLLVISKDGGKTWNQVHDNKFTAKSIVWSEALQKFVAAGNYGQVRQSADGENWELVADGSMTPFIGLATNSKEGAFVAVGSNGSRYSPDGSNWDLEIFNYSKTVLGAIYIP